MRIKLLKNVKVAEIVDDEPRVRRKDEKLRVSHQVGTKLIAESKAIQI